MDLLRKTQKTPPSEIEKAKKYRKDFIERNGRIMSEIR